MGENGTTPELECLSYFNESLENLNKKDFKKGLEYAQKSMAALHKTGKKKLDMPSMEGHVINESNICWLIGRAYKGLGNYNLALEFYNRWTELAIEDEGERSLQIGYCYWNIAELLSRLPVPTLKQDSNFLLRLYTFRTSELYLNNGNKEVTKNYEMAYNILSEQLGREHSKVRELRKEIIEYHCVLTLSPTTEETLWHAGTFFVILLLVTFSIWHISLKTLTITILGMLIFLFLRIVYAFIIMLQVYLHWREKLK